MYYLNLYTFLIFLYLTYIFSHQFYLNMGIFLLSLSFLLSLRYLSNYLTDCTHSLLTQIHKIYSSSVVKLHVEFYSNLKTWDLKSLLLLLGLKSVSELLLVMSSIAIFCINLTFNIIVLWVNLCNNFIIAKPEISSKNGASIFISFCSFGFNISLSGTRVLIYLRR